MTARSFLFGDWVPNTSRHCTIGKPASIIVASWRVKMTMSRDLIDSPKPGMLISRLEPLPLLLDLRRKGLNAL